MTSLLLETPLSQEQQEYAELVRGAGQVLLSRINDLLDFSQLGATPRPLECVDFNLRTLVEEVLDAFSTPAQQKGLNLITHIPNEVPTWVVGAPRQLRRVLSSLVDNAVKFTEVGEVVVAVACTGDCAQETCVQIEVRDTGIGIAPDAQAKLFTPFAQGDSSSTRAHGGTGLGLAIASQLTSQMNGTMEVSSTPGQGSTFRVTLRITKSPR
jgi:signal transduction histidine kinase